MSNQVDQLTINDGRKKKIIVGSRKSQLAMIQTNIVIEQLKHYYNDLEFIIKNIDTTGDNILDKALSQIGEKALFTRELEEELLENKIDIIVHSLKDLPTILPNNCCIGAILKREDPSDSLVLRNDLKTIPHDTLESVLNDPNVKIFGSSSLRRIAQLKDKCPSVETKNVRGNLNTRLNKLNNPSLYGYDCLILATSGLKRAGFQDYITVKLDWYHAVSQGALGVECRANDLAMIELLRPLVDDKTVFECTAERVFLKCIEGGCSVPIGVRTNWKKSFILTIQTKVLSIDGKKSLTAECTRNLDDDTDETLFNFTLSDYTDIKLQFDNQFSLRIKNSVILGREIAKQMIELGAKDILNN